MGTAVVEISNTMESGFEDDFAPMQSSNGVVAEDSSFILGQDEAEVPEESPKKNSEGGDAGDDPNSTASSDLSLSVSKQTEPREDPEVIKLWKENQIKMLQEKDEDEEKAKEALKKEATTEKLTPGTEWERVAKLCDFNPKTARNTKDV